MRDTVKFIYKWNKFGLGLRRLAMDLGDKKATQSMSVAGLTITALDALVVLVDQCFVSILPDPWGKFIAGLAGITGLIVTGLGYRRAIGKNGR